MISTTGKTVQQVIDEVACAVIAQGKRCIFDGACVYGDGRGNHCAVGWLLPPDNKRLMEVEGTIFTLMHSKAFREQSFENKSFIESNAELLSDLQLLHDSSVNNSEEFYVERAFERIANKGYSTEKLKQMHKTLKGD